MLSSMNSSAQNSANPLIAKIQQLFSRDLALVNDYLRQENRHFRRAAQGPSRHFARNSIGKKPSFRISLASALRDSGRIPG
jgi:hypothetical protein